MNLVVLLVEQPILFVGDQQRLKDICLTSNRFNHHQLEAFFLGGWEGSSKLCPQLMNSWVTPPSPTKYTLTVDTDIYLDSVTIRQFFEPLSSTTSLINNQPCLPRCTMFGMRRFPDNCPGRCFLTCPRSKPYNNALKP